MIDLEPARCAAGFVAIILSCKLLFAAAPTAIGQELGDAGAGRRLADTWCSSCHVVVPTQASATSNGAPTFAAIASMPSATPLALRAFLQTPHARMPDLHLSRSEIDDLITYLLSLRRK